MKLLGFPVVFVLLLSIGFGFVPSSVKVNSFSPQVNCLVSNGFSVKNNCGYGFEVVKNGIVLRSLERGDVVSSSELFAGCGSSNCFLQHGDEKVRVFLSFELGTDKISSSILLIFLASIFSSASLLLFILFNYFKKKKTSCKVKLLFIISVLTALIFSSFFIMAG